MEIQEKKMNIQTVKYNGFANIPMPFVKFQTIADYFFNNDCALISVDSDTVLEAFKVFQYNRYPYNGNVFSCSIYELKNKRKKEFVVRFVEWDKQRTKEKIMKKEKDLQVLLNSGVYYLGYDTSVEIKKILQSFRRLFEKNISFVEGDEAIFSRHIYIEYHGFSKTLHWDAPYCNKEIEEFIEKKILLLKDIATNNASSMIPSVEFLFDVDPLKYEDCCFSNE